MNTNTQNTTQPASATRPDCAPPIGSQFWPCPHRCEAWARCEPVDLKFPAPNHHSKCEHYNASLIDVWRVCIPGESGGLILDDKEEAEMAARDNSEEDEPLEVVPSKMHREVYENLPEFDGF